MPTDKLIQEVKKRMGYKSAHTSCKDCMHCVYVEKTLDASHCYLNPSVPFQVNPDTDNCNHYESGKKT